MPRALAAPPLVVPTTLDGLKALLGRHVRFFVQPPMSHEAAAELVASRGQLANNKSMDRGLGQTTLIRHWAKRDSPLGRHLHAIDAIIEPLGMVNEFMGLNHGTPTDAVPASSFHVDKKLGLRIEPKWRLVLNYN